MLEAMMKAAAVKKDSKQEKPKKTNDLPAILNVLPVDPDDSPCPGCGFGSWWQPRFADENSPWIVFTPLSFATWQSLDDGS